MTPEQLGDHFRARLGASVVDAEVAFGQLTVTVEPDALPTAARLCKEDDKLDFAFFDWMSGVDLGEEGFAVVTHLYSIAHRHHVSLRAVAPGGREDPRLPSITGVYRGANWHEREAYDMFGVTFDGHPGLLPRILTVENFEGFPLRKDFLLATREAKAWPGLKEPKDPEEAAGDGDEAAVAAKAEEKKAAAAAKAERAKAKAAEMRAKKRRERAAGEQRPEGGDQTERDAAAAGEDQAAAAERTGGGDTDAEAAAQVAAAAGEEAVQTPEGAAEVAQSDIAKDAAAGSVQGDTLAGAPGDERGVDEPVSDPDAEAVAGEGAPPVASGTPGIEAEGAHADTPVGPSADPDEAGRGADAPEPTKPRRVEGTDADADPDAPHEGSGSQGAGGVGNEDGPDRDDSDKDS